MKYPASLLFFLAALPAAAADIRVDGSYRLRLNGESNYLLDGSGARLGQERWMEHRLRLTPKIIEQDQIEVQGSFDVLRGLVAGDLAPAFQDLGWQGRSNRDGVHASGFDFRHLFVKFRLPFGVFEFGQMPSDWGMGMLINGGNQEEGPDFGDVRFGDIVDRVLFATRPFGFLGPRSEIAQHVALALAADLIYRDRNAQLVTTTGTGGLHWGDVASQLVAALVWDPGPESRAGLYVARRWQQYAAGGGSLHTWLVDLHARTLFPLEWLGGTVSLEAEAAEIYGSTTHSPNLSALFRSQVGQQGVAARALLSRGTLEARLEPVRRRGHAVPVQPRLQGRPGALRRGAALPDAERGAQAGRSEPRRTASARGRPASHRRRSGERAVSEAHAALAPVAVRRSPAAGRQRAVCPRGTAIRRPVQHARRGRAAQSVRRGAGEELRDRDRRRDLLALAPARRRRV